MKPSAVRKHTPGPAEEQPQHREAVVTRRGQSQAENPKISNAQDTVNKIPH